MVGTWTHSANQLGGESQRLAALVARFKVPGESAAPATPSPARALTPATREPPKTLPPAAARHTPGDSI